MSISGEDWEGDGLEYFVGFHFLVNGMAFLC